MNLGDLLVSMFPHLITAVAMYAAIRADLSQLNARIANVEKATDRAHARLDNGVPHRRSDD